MSTPLHDLNSIQLNAVQFTDGPVMVIAGAGSGKTRVLTYRIAHLIKSGVNPFSILALTFTNKAAKEMKERVILLTGGMEARNIWIGTFHSIFARALRMESDRIGYPSNFTIYDTTDSKNQIKTIIKELGLDDKIYKPGLIQHRISLSKNNLISPAGYNNDEFVLREDRLSGKPRLGEIYQIYVTRCFKAGAMDFDDLLYKMNYLLTEFPDVLHTYQRKFQYVLIDEFQDTNLLQYAIVKKLAAFNENICVVGDDAQSIYAFRGANIQNILNFKRDYPDLVTYKLEQNYRSTKNIVNAANCVIKNNKQQLHKEVWTDNEEGERLTVLKALTDNEEGHIVARFIYELKVNKQLHNNVFAILYRTNAQSRAMEEALRKINLPYRIYGGLSFYQRKEVKDLLAYFRLAVNNNDEESLRRVINYPVRGIGTRSIEKAVVAASESGKTVWQVISNPIDPQLGLSSGVISKIYDFVYMIKSFSAQLEIKTAYELADLIAASSGILKDLYENKTPEGLSRYENLQELLNGIKEFTDSFKLKPRSADMLGQIAKPLLSAFLQDIELLTDADTGDPDDNDRVSLMTLHAAKGLEFSCVCIVGLEENLFPSPLSINSRDELEEERRLFYVGLTRAKVKVLLSFAQTRYKWGSLTHCEPSRFLEEIDSAYLDYPAASTVFREPQLRTRSPLSRNWQGNKYKRKDRGEVRPDVEKQKKHKNIVKLKTAEDSAEFVFETDNGAELQVGMEVEHQRFGLGKVIHLEGANANKKATVFFKTAGQKQLLLKYARLKILSN